MDLAVLRTETEAYQAEDQAGEDVHEGDEYPLRLCQHLQIGAKPAEAE